MSIGYQAPGGSSSVTLPIAETDVTNLTTDLAAKAPLASPTFTGTPSLPTGTTATTQTNSDSSTKLATTAHVKSVTLDTLTAPAADVSMNTHKLTNVVDPATAQQAATKNYVDAGMAYPIAPNTWSNIPFASSSTTVANAGDGRWARMLMPVTGTLDGIWVVSETLSGNGRIYVLDTGQAQAGTTRTCLYIGPSGALPASGSYFGVNGSSSPALGLSVTRGMTLEFLVTISDITGKIANFGFQQAGWATPPSPVGGSSGAGTSTGKLAGTILAANLPTTTSGAGSTVTDANMATGSTVVPYFMFHITPA